MCTGWFISSGYETARTHSDLTSLLRQISLHIPQSHQSTLPSGDGDKMTESTITDIYAERTFITVNILFSSPLPIEISYCYCFKYLEHNLSIVC